MSQQYHYLYTNDMRVSTLEAKAKDFAHMFLTNSLPSADEDKSTNNNGKTIGYYLTLEHKGNLAKIASNQDLGIVIRNFIKKFQFPNPRTKENLIESIQDNISIAPLREVIKLLFIARLNGEINPYITKQEIIDFIFYNELLAKTKNKIDRFSIYNDILKFRQSQILPSYIAKDDERYWNHQDRQVSEILELINYSGLFEYKDNKVRFVHENNITPNKAYWVYDIIGYDKYWDYSNLDIEKQNIKEIRESFYEYMEEGVELASSDEKLSKSLFDQTTSTIRLPKSFILLAGISGTGKTRFIREQAKLTGNLDETYCLVSVRPDWHEPSDLLGYISRIGGSETYVTTDVLRFIVAAWKEIFQKLNQLRQQDTAPNANSQYDLTSIQTSPISLKHLTGNLFELDQIRPFWLCLDEMNLAPVEQYFADYLSILETRTWKWRDNNFEYQCDPILNKTVINSIGESAMKKALGLAETELELQLWNAFKISGIPLPFNLIVAGTVNMDETTHGFSRKVIDRALSFNFGEFFPNEFDHYFSPNHHILPLSYPIRSNVTDEISHELKQKTLKFLKAVNNVLNNTPFEVAFRALNELFLSVESVNPKDEIEFEAVCDDFMMQKILPRIEGDIDKLRIVEDIDKLKIDEDNTILSSLNKVLSEQLERIWKDDNRRPDLYRISIENNAPMSISCRSKQKIKWMERRLETVGYTSFWA